MIKFGEILKNSLEGIYDSFEQASSDLEAVVANLGEEIANLIGDGKCDLRLSKVDADLDKVVLRLSASNAKSEAIIGDYMITLKGYPISFGECDRYGTESFHRKGRILDREELEAHFAQMLGDKNSQLVLFIAFAQRDSTSTHSVALSAGQE